MRFIFLLVPLVLSSTQAFSSTFFVEKATANDAGKANAEAVTTLVRTSVTELGHEVESAKEKADFTLRPTLLSLGASTVVTLEKFKGDKIIYSTKLKAMQVEELDDIVKRLVRSAIGEVSASKDVRVNEVSEAESQEGLRRRPALKGYHFGLGPAFFQNLNTSGAGYYFSLGYVFDVNKAFLKISGEFAGKGGALTANVGIGVMYFLSDTDFAPFLGADLGYGVARLDTGSLFSSDWVGSFILGPTVGVQVFRTSSVSLELSVRWAFFLNSGSLGAPSFLATKVGLYF